MTVCRAGRAAAFRMCSRRRPSAEHNLAIADPVIAAQWHPTLNGSLRADHVAPRSQARAWWLCTRGHVSQTSVAARTKVKTGCPACAQEFMPAPDCLAVTHPELAAQWHPELNDDASPEEVTYGSKRKPWWLCPQGHSWQAVICNRVRGAGCPYCAGKLPTATNNLGVHNPALGSAVAPGPQRGGHAGRGHPVRWPQDLVVVPGRARMGQ